MSQYRSSCKLSGRSAESNLLLHNIPEMRRFAMVYSESRRGFDFRLEDIVFFFYYLYLFLFDCLSHHSKPLSEPNSAAEQKKKTALQWPEAA